MGKIVVIEGTDFSGKTTQYEKLKERLAAEGYFIGTDSFPNYDSESSYFVRAYLGGKFSETAEEIHPKVASLFYGLDRYASYKTKEWGKIYDNGGNILFARYISSNILHQASKYHTQEEKVEFIKWLYDTEVGMLGIPKEDKVILLDMPPEWGQKLKVKRLEEQGGLSSSGGVKDIHELDTEHLLHAYETAMSVAEILDWKVVHCVENNRLKSIEEIHKEIYDLTISIFHSK